LVDRTSGGATVGIVNERRSAARHGLHTNRASLRLHETFHDRGALTLRVLGSSESIEHVRQISVSDTGAGIGEEDAAAARHELVLKVLSFAMATCGSVGHVGELEVSALVGRRDHERFARRRRLAGRADRAARDRMERVRDVDEDVERERSFRVVTTPLIFVPRLCC
jgi:hypothetical protein